MHRSLKTLSGGSSGGGGMSSLTGMLGGGGGGGGGGDMMGKVVSMGLKFMSSRGGGGGGDIGSILGSLIGNSNSSGWHKQTPVLSSNEVPTYNPPPLFYHSIISRC